MADQPHKWAILNDYAKNVITLATSLLALSVTFADKLGSNSPDIRIRILLGAIWFFLGLSTISGVLLAAALFGVLRRKGRLEEVDAELASTTLPAPTRTALQEEKTRLSTESKARENQLTRVTNATYLSIICSVAAFFFLGVMPKSATIEVPQIVQKVTTEAAEIRNLKPADLKLLSLELSANGDLYTIQLLPPGTATPLTIEVSSLDGKIRKFH
jgi:hypothetical protein